MAKSKREPEEVARAYFSALSDRDVDAMLAQWHPGGEDHLGDDIGVLRAPDEIREFFDRLFTALPDGGFEVLQVLPQGDKVAVHWRLSGTFAGGPLMGVQPTGSLVDVRGIDLVTVRDGLIERNDAYLDSSLLARQLGALPAADSPPEKAMMGMVNLRTKTLDAVRGVTVEPVAEGVWVARGGFPSRTMNVYLIEADDGLTMFDTGIADMAGALQSLAARFGGLSRIVLGHSHADHRGAAAALAATGVPIHCHPDERADAEGDGGYHSFSFGELAPVVRSIYPHLLKHWDGGPVEIAGTLEEGDTVAGFEVVAIPGHAPGMIALWRTSDRLALSSDCFYTVDPQTTRHTDPGLPHRAFTPDYEQARASLRKVAALEPAAAWPGHADPVVGDVRERLERAAETS
ncbi:MAG: ester cyclase [Solirubrobacterales bacterium]